jgi:hypothetical protein
MPRSYPVLLFIALLGLSACAAPSYRSTAPARSPATASAAYGANSITPADIHTHVAYLASDELMGRDTPSPGLEKAATYLARAFERYGLEPGGDGDSYLQRFPLYRTRVEDAETHFTWTSGETTGAWRYGTDFFVIPTKVDTATGRAFYAGLPSALSDGLPADAEGGIVFFSIPGAPTETASWDKEAAQAVAHAQQAGAASVVFLLNDEVSDAEVAKLNHAMAGRSRLPLPLSAVVLREQAAEALFAAAGVDLNATRHALPDGLPVAVGRVDFQVSLRDDEHHPANVVAVLPGSDPTLRDSYIVFSAHYDHVGVGQPDATGDAIYNGADDNASGTAALLELAQAFASLPSRPARSLVFLAVSGEEKGLLGSAHFADHPTVPGDQIVANINMDMIGRNAPDSVTAIGQEYTSMGAVAQRTAAEHPDLGLVVAYDEHPEERHFYRSDHFNFVRKGIPAIFFNAGTHEDYHQASDELSNLDVDKTGRVTRLIYYVAAAVASDPDAPTWTDEGEHVLQALAQQNSTR